jgi:O-antigen/teichoic acid export membrane protein
LSIRTLSRDFVFYGLLDFSQRSLSILLVPIYTRVLTQSSYGNLDLILTVCSVLTVIVDLQFVSGFTRLYLDNVRTGLGPTFVGTAMLTRIGIGAIAVALFLGLGFGGFLELKFMPSFLAYRWIWTLAAITVPITFAFDILLVQAQMLRRKRQFFAGAFGNTFLLTVLSLVFTVFVPLGIFGVVLAQFLGKVIATALLFGGLWADVTFDFHGPILKELIGYSLPLVPGRWVGHADTYMSRFFVYASLGAAENAVLAITTKMAVVLGLFCVAFRTAWQPLAMSYIGNEGSDTFYVRSLRLLTAGGILSMYALTILSKPALVILAPGSYGAAELYVPFFLIGVLISEIDVNLQLGNQIAKKTGWISASSAAAIVMNIAVLAELTPRLGIYAACLGTLLSCVTRVTVTYFSAQRNCRIPYDKRSLAVLAAACGMLAVLSLGRSFDLLNYGPFLVAVITFGAGMTWLATGASERLLLKRSLSELRARLPLRRSEFS